MRFRSGLLGTMICVAAIMGTIVVGYASTVYEGTEYVTEYTYITDITGLFETERSPTYIEYSPSGNWTGYYTDDSGDTDGINFTTSSIASVYVVQSDHEDVDLGEVDVGSDDHSEDLDVQQFYSHTVGTYVSKTYIAADEWYQYNFSVKTLLAALGLDSTLSYATVTISGLNCAASNDPATSNPRVTLQSAVHTVMFTVPAINTTDTSELVESITVNIAEGSVKGYNADGEMLFDGYSWESVVVLMSSDAESNDLNISYTPSYSATYMNIQDGVSLSTSPVTWSNGYENSDIQILMVRPDKTSEFQTSWTFYLGTLVYDEDAEPYGQWNFVETGDTVTITAYSDAGQTKITVYENGVDVASYDLSSWTRWIIEYDAVNGIVYLTPLTSYDSMTSYKEYKTFAIATLSVTGVFEEATVTW